MRVSVRLCSGPRLPGTVHFAGTRAFRSLDAGAEMHGGIWSRWGLGFVFLWGGVLFECVVLALPSSRATKNYHDVERGLRGFGGFPRIRNPCASASSVSSAFRHMRRTFITL